MRVRVVIVTMAILSIACGGAASSSGLTDPGRTLRIEMSDFAFTPATITLKPGEEVTLSFTNVGTLEHEFMVGTTAMAGRGFMQDWLAMAKLEPLGGHDRSGHAGESVRVPPHGAATLLIVVPPQVGEFEFGCFVEGHYERGMTGKLVVDAGVAPNAIPNVRTSATPTARPTPSPTPTHAMGDTDDEAH